MIGIIILVVLSIITMALLSVQFETKKDAWGDTKIEKTTFKPCLRSLLGLLWLVLILFDCFVIVKPNNVGIAYNPFKGGVQGETLGEGYKTKSPLTSVYQLSTTVEEMTFENYPEKSGSWKILEK